MAMSFLSFQSSSKVVQTRTRHLAGESLECRTLLAADALAASAQHGDANLDGIFNSADLVQVFQAGKYETSEAADWNTGDWNFDGLFDSNDLVRAFQEGAYSRDATALVLQPLRGSIEAVENTVDVSLPTFTQHGLGSGNATHLGHYTVTYQFVVNSLTFVGVGSATFIAANGDSFFTEVDGLGTDPAINPVSTVVEQHTITGGTGRFEGATGNFTVVRTIDTTTGITSGSFDGTIVVRKGQ